MATSGTYLLNSTFNDIAEEALDQLQIGADGETLSGDMLERSKKTFNFMLKAWEGQGIHLWTQEEGTLFLVEGQSKYDLATANVANTWHETALSADEAAGQMTLSVDNTDNMNTLDIIGVFLDTNIIHWTSILGKTATEVTITVPLPSAAASGNLVRHYARDSFIPVTRIMNTRRRESVSYEIPINFESREDYFNLPDKVSKGSPVQSYFSRQQPPGFMYIWPPPASEKDAINFTYERPMQIIDNGTDNIDIPAYWSEAIVYGLAERLATKFGCSAERAAMISRRAASALNMALEYDSELYPITMVMKNA